MSTTETPSKVAHRRDRTHYLYIAVIIAVTPVTFTYTTTVPLSSVANTTVASWTGTGAVNSYAHQPANSSSYTFANGTTMTTNPVTAPAGSMSWVVTVTVAAGTSLRLSTQALGCKPAGPSATVTIDCPFTYAIDCPF